MYGVVSNAQFFVRLNGISKISLSNPGVLGRADVIETIKSTGQTFSDTPPCTPACTDRIEVRVRVVCDAAHMGL
jgi:hypothetical protein